MRGDGVHDSYAGYKKFEREGKKVREETYKLYERPRATAE